MQLTFTRQGSRTLLTCSRADGSTDQSDLGPSLPYHDLAHFVAESDLGLTDGFFGSVAAGRTMDELSDATLIPTLPPGSMQAEIASRGVGSLATGACRPEQLAELVNSELEHLGLPLLTGLDTARAERLLTGFRDLVARFEAVAEGDSLKLVFADPSRAQSHPSGLFRPN